MRTIGGVGTFKGSCISEGILRNTHSLNGAEGQA